VGKEQREKQDDEEAKQQNGGILSICQWTDGQVRVGLTATMDGAWQKRSSGNNYNSRTGHNFAVGGFSGLIIALVVFSKHCRMCEVAKKKEQRATKEHRCPRTFPWRRVPSPWRELVLWSTARMSSVEPGAKCRAYIRQIVTDDDSTTRANLRHSIKGSVWMTKYGDGGWIKGDHWPRVDPDDPKSKLCDNGLMPLWVPQVLLYLCDISHRVKVIGSMCYDIKKGKDPRPPPVIAVLDDEDEMTLKMGTPVLQCHQEDQEESCTQAQETKEEAMERLTKEEQEHRSKNNMQKYDCEKIKVLAGYYLHGNKHLPFEEYCQKAHCIYLHHFNDHSCCNRKWCKPLRCKEDGTELPADYCVNNKFRDKESMQNSLKR
jgi:hypothetical protein